MNIKPQFTLFEMETNSSEQNKVPRGYVKLAKFMVKHHHVILKEYRELAVRDLLYLQAEICDLQYDLAKQGIIDANTNGDSEVYDRDWWHLQSAQMRGLEGKQWALILQVREKIREYCMF